MNLLSKINVIQQKKKIPVLNACIIPLIYCISNAIGNKKYGNIFSEYDICNFFFNFNETKICIWTISHFFIHFIGAFEYDLKPLQQMFYGFYWEFIEEYIIDLIPYMKSECSKGNYKGNYWRGDHKDIYFNILGMFFGSLFKKKKYLKTQKKKVMLNRLILITLLYNIGLHIKMKILFKKKSIKAL